MSVFARIRRVIGGRITVLAGAVAGVAGLHASPVVAQPARHCDGALAANFIYSNVLQSRGGADVEYHTQLQNVDAQRRQLSVTLLQMQPIGTFNVLRPMQPVIVTSYQPKDVMLLAVHTSTPSGSGAPSPSVVGQAIRFSCQVLP